MRAGSLIAVAAALAAALSSPDPAGGIADDVFTVHSLVSASSASAQRRMRRRQRWGWADFAMGVTTARTRRRSQRQRPLLGGPTGTVFKVAADFVINQNGKTGAARFLFATEGGTILGWSPTVNASTAIPGVDRSASGAVYKGLTTASDRLYATDFHNNRVDVFDASFNPVSTATFQDPKIPKGYAPFGIQALAGSIFVTYEAGRREARRRRRRLRLRRSVHLDGRSSRASRREEEERTAQRRGACPRAGFSGDILIGNFGNGRVSAYQDRGGQVGVQGTAAPRRPNDRDDRRPLIALATARREDPTTPTSRPAPAAGPALDLHRGLRVRH
jgi:hypothetical protein